ncbi:hypothetical protein [Arsenophonus nasoniae]|uniref:SMODS and SLOG-associating 2TM effector domain-containing protein n=1 Tax=Arsenophonus nasoniae TaxID=638 RepID=A0AA95K0W5_9GAMM|nr:hypothetical protein [Arsenophonus nasoniae]WGL95984.1 hypothetical protein QE207_05200 [Arsenophonus nasoniae]
MNREEITDILYSHYLERSFATITERIDKLISVLMLIFGSAIVLKGNPFFFGILVVILSSIQATYQFGKKSGSAKKKSVDYLKLYTNQSKYDDNELRERLLELESTDEIIWSCLEPIALLKTQIRLGIEPKNQEKLSYYHKFIRLICG